jgi:putative endonuclease
MTTARQSLGRWGEKLAAEYLAARGYKILESNARTPYGEIDLVACQDEPGFSEESGLSSVTIFVEVKTRATRTFGYPEESVNPRKQAHMLASAQAYIQAHPQLGDHWRIDVIAIQRQPAGLPPLIRHFINAIG